MSRIRRGLWALAVAGALCGAYIMVATFRKAETAAEQGDCAMVAIAFTLIPYCLARAASEVSSRVD